MNHDVLLVSLQDHSQQPANMLQFPILVGEEEGEAHWAQKKIFIKINETNF